MDRITRHRNWGLHVAVAVAVALVSVIAATDWSPWPSRWPAFVALGLLTLAYVTYGWRGYDEPRAAAAFVPLLVVVALALPAVVPSTAFIQSVLFPVAWCQVERIRTAVWVSVAIGIASGVGLQIASGLDALAGTIIIEAISVLGACALGLWISRIARLSDERRRLIEQLEATQQSLAEANRAAGVTSERERLAREIHDTVAQDLAGIVMLTERARADLAADRSDRLDERLAVLEESARTALEESRTWSRPAPRGSPATAWVLRCTGSANASPARQASRSRSTRRTARSTATRRWSCSASVRRHWRTSAHTLGPPRRASHCTWTAGASSCVSRTTASASTPLHRPSGTACVGCATDSRLAGGTCVVTSTPGTGTAIEASVPAGAEPSLPAAPEQSSVFGATR